MGNKSSKKEHVHIANENKNCNCRRQHRCLQECLPKPDANHDHQSLAKMAGMHDEDLEGWQFTKRHETACHQAIQAYDISSDVLLAIFMFLRVYAVEGAFYIHGHAAINAYIEHGGSLCPKWLQHRVHGKPLNLKLFGSTGSGKSWLLMQCAEGSSNLDAERRVQYEVDREFVLRTTGVSVALHIEAVTEEEDQFGSGVFRINHEIMHTDIALLCFAINGVDAVEACIHFYRRLIRQWDVKAERQQNIHCNGTKGVMLVACKMDLMYDVASAAKQNVDTESDEAQKRKVMSENYAKALKLSTMLNIPLVETSAAKKINVNAMLRQSIFEYWLQTETQSIGLLDGVTYNNL